MYNDIKIHTEHIY